jgi:ribosomal protein S18 acetylase RimI-like enzyme
MISVPGTELTPRAPAGIIVRRAAGDADLAAAAAVQHQAYELPAPPGPHDIARLSGLTQRGGLVGVAVDEVSGAVVAAGLIDVAGERPAVGELAAVGVLAAFRRRGIAAAIAAHLAGAAHADGIGLVFLEAEPDEERIYRRTGFLDAAAKIWASLR